MNNLWPIAVMIAAFIGLVIGIWCGPVRRPRGSGTGHYSRHPMGDFKKRKF